MTLQMPQKWRFSLLLLIVYVSLFSVWTIVPSRTVYLAGGGLALVVLVARFVSATREHYFASRADSRLHALVIADVFLETVSFEVFRWFQPQAVAETFHRNMNFVGCTVAFTLLIGGYRYFALRRSEFVTRGESAL